MTRTMRLVRDVVHDTVRRPGWCTTHGDFAWGYPDGSTGCFYACNVEISVAECVFVRGALELPRGTVKGRVRA